MTDEGRRRIEVLRSGNWISTRMRWLKKGDKYRMFEPDGTLVVGAGDFEGVEVFLAVANPEETEKGVWGVRSIASREESNNDT